MMGNAVKNSGMQEASGSSARQENGVSRRGQASIRKSPSLLIFPMCETESILACCACPDFQIGKMIKLCYKKSHCLW